MHGWGELAEGKGFEPSIPVSQYNGLANRRLQPLGHLSAIRLLNGGWRACQRERTPAARAFQGACEIVPETVPPVRLTSSSIVVAKTQ